MPAERSASQPNTVGLPSTPAVYVSPDEVHGTTSVLGTIDATTLAEAHNPLRCDTSFNRAVCQDQCHRALRWEGLPWFDHELGSFFDPRTRVSVLRAWLEFFLERVWLTHVLRVYLGGLNADAQAMLADGYVGKAQAALANSRRGADRDATLIQRDVNLDPGGRRLVSFR